MPLVKAEQSSPGVRSHPASVILIEDDQSLRDSLLEYIQGKGFQVVGAKDAEEAFSLLDAETEVVLSDLKLPGASGFDVLREVRRKNPRTEVIIITGYGSIDSAVAAMREGAYNYLTKPVNPTVLIRFLEELTRRRRLEDEVEHLRRQLDEQYGFENLIGRSPLIRRVFEIIRQVAPTRTTVLITGESGTGKELVARALHQNSKRRDGPFVAINCAALPQTLIESELFGHERGAFTGAVQRKRGLLHAADGGTLFIDEVGEVDLPVQAKLLRVIESRQVTPLGSTKEELVDIRILTATNKDLDERVKNGSFREDLFYRLKVVTIQLPPLRDRREDVPLLAQAFLKQVIADNELPPRRISTEVLSRLTAYDWPGNVRELRNVIEGAAVLSKAEDIQLSDLPPPLVELPVRGVQGLFQVGMTMDELERLAMLETLRNALGNRTKAAGMLGISLRTLQRKIKQYRLEV